MKGPVNKSLSVVIPAYNEESSLIGVVQRVLANPYIHEIIVVDDCSRDRTGQIADELQLSKETVRNHVRQLLRAMGVSSRLEAVALSHGRTRRNRSERGRRGSPH